MKLPTVAPGAWPAWVDDSYEVRLVLTGAPRTKKNHGVTAILPSKYWTRWSRQTVIEMRMPHRPNSRLWIPPGFGRPSPDRDVVAWLATGRAMLPSLPFNCCAHFYRDTAGPGDAVGYYQGLADLLELRKVVNDDHWISQWDGSRVLLDRERPRVEVCLSPA